jgi:hypothetical protein
MSAQPGIDDIQLMQVLVQVRGRNLLLVQQLFLI